MKNLKSAWETLQAVLNKEDELRKEYEEKIANLEVLKENVSVFIRESEDTLENVEYDPRVPFESWKVVSADKDRAVQAYRDIRDQVAASNKAAKNFDHKMGQHKDIIGNWLLQQANEQNVNSFKTDHGTAFRQLKVMASPANWDQFVDWCNQNDAADALYKRVNTNFIKQYVEDNDGEEPPFLNVIREYEIVVRKS